MQPKQTSAGLSNRSKFSISQGATKCQLPAWRCFRSNCAPLCMIIARGFPRAPVIPVWGMLSGYIILLRVCAANPVTAAAAASVVPRLACTAQFHHGISSKRLSAALLPPASLRCAAAAAPRHRSSSALAMATQLAPRAQEVLDFW